MRPRSIGRGRALSRARAARAGEAGIRRLPASRFPVPPGMTPRGISVPTSAAAACMVVPSPPNTATMSTSWATPYSASSRAWPGPTVARTSTSHPPLRRVLATRSMPTRAVRAAIGFAMRSDRVISELPFPLDVGADLVGVGGQNTEVPAAGLECGLDTGLKTPLPAEAKFQTRAQVVVAELAQVLRTEPSVQGQKRLTAQLPAGRQVGERLRSPSVGHPRADLDEVERDPQVLDERTLQFTRQGTGEV